MGLVPPLSAVGDVFVHVDGGDTPLLLRPKHGQDREARPVGSFYVHGYDEIGQGKEYSEWILE